ncbi:glycoside hydrolase family 2 TIM barrel-domain containing protein [Paraflavitalea pollutisoli]|uniref:glycoside hydrolase family 2 TIM barrel-domain containing protein n=1 Tax=Paraflavitalea pollutisoli TaxID=3034143 RepID=UPI0023EC294E|nr:glycoside hydrolase family 2 TIM barrel-domain containing protein [Paraflavitalea sp. H1-2-19X]
MMFYRRKALAGLVLLLGLRGQAQQFLADGRTPLAPLPQLTVGMAQAMINLNGTWEINRQPGASFWLDQEKGSNWQQIQVPGEAAMQGYPITNDKPFVYRHTIAVPDGAANKTLLLRFNGVYSYARVWVNGRYVREHFGGFTAWDCDITPYVQPGKSAVLHVEVTDRADDISYASGYAHHPIGGILRNVQLLVVPRVHLQRVYAQASLTDDLRNGTLALNMALNEHAAGASLVYALMAPGGKKVAGKTLLPSGDGTWHEALTIDGVQPWTAEDPQLYTLEVKLLQQGKVQEVIRKMIGFRKVTIDAQQQLLVNGRPVKLRGACRHDMHPLLGRSTNRRQDSLDVVLAKEANLNFIRTSHYPPSQDFLEFCDRYGIYVQEETAICFVLDWREGVYAKDAQTQDNPAYTGRYLGQLSEMIDRDRDHAAVIMWSVGNESYYGSNFRKEYDFVKSVDSSRPVSWSFPATALDKGQRCFDILVSHYPNYDGRSSDLGKYEKHMKADYPIIGDEWAHVACYNTGLLNYDPNVKDAWGKSLDSVWSYRFDVPGYIGGAIWGMIDETFHLPDTATGYGPWGFIDVWRRKKAEFWNTKKAYSPIRVLQTRFDGAAGGVLKIPVKNRFDHLSLSDITCKVSGNGKTIRLSLPAVLPHQEGSITLAASNYPRQWALLQFYDARGALVDEERITWAPAAKQVTTTAVGAWTITEADGQLRLRSGKFDIVVNKTTGLIASAAVGNSTLLTGSPVLAVNYPAQANAFKDTKGVFSGAYVPQEAQVDVSNVQLVRIRLKGLVDKYPVSMRYELAPSGKITVHYEADSIPPYTWDIGIQVPVANSLNQVSWQRNGYWTTYPTDHLSALQGKALRNSMVKEAYRVKPAYAVAQSMSDYYLQHAIDPAKAALPASERYRAKKENILSYTLTALGKKGGLRVVSDGSQAAGMNVGVDGQQSLLVSDKWDYWSLAWGNYQGKRNRSRTMQGTVQLILE